MNGRTNASATMVDAIEIPLDPVTNLNAEAGNGSVRFTWTDPKNKYATPEGETAQDPDQLVSVWKYTKVVRKTGSYPQNPNDGVVVVESGVHNQYQTNPYIDEGLTNNTTYFYSVYVINEDEVESDPVQTSVTPTAGVALSSLPEGTIIKINENGSPVEFFIASHSYETGINGTGKTLLLRTTSYQNYRFGDYPGSTPFGYCNNNGGIDGLLNDTLPGPPGREPNIENMYIGRFESKVIDLIPKTKFKWNNIGYGIRTSEDYAFILSVREYGWTDRVGYESIPNLEDSALPNYEILRTIPSATGSTAISYWTRCAGSDGNAFYMSYRPSDNSIDCHYAGSNFQYGVRPCFLIYSNAFVDSSTMLITGDTI